MKIRVSILLVVAIGLAFTGFNENLPARPGMESSAGIFRNSILQNKIPAKVTRPGASKRANAATR